MKRINVLWALPLILPFVFVAMIRLLWVVMGLPWAPDNIGAGFVVVSAMILCVMSAIIVGIWQDDGSGIWWTFKKEKSDEQQ